MVGRSSTKTIHLIRRLMELWIFLLLVKKVGKREELIMIRKNWFF